MNIKALGLAASLAWGAVAVSTVTPANAIAITSQVGVYAACSANSTPQYSEYDCWINGNTDQAMFSMNYIQTIKFVGQACNAGGGCADNTGTVYTDFVYGEGRKTASQESTCTLSMRRYVLGTCAC